jgi:hypothetical protein
VSYRNHAVIFQRLPLRLLLLIGVHRRLEPGEPAVNLLTASNYAILMKASISTVPTFAITGDIAV